MRKAKDRMFHRDLNQSWDHFEESNLEFILGYHEMNDCVARLKSRMPLLSQNSTYRLSDWTDVLDYTFG